VLEEAKWGLDWVLKTRFGDGYRVATASKSCWSDNVIGTDDDIVREAALEPIENFMCAGAEALAAAALRAEDPVLAAYCEKCAREDWRFAYDNQDKNGLEKRDDPNRIYTPLLMYAAGCWSAIDLYNATGDAAYRDRAAEFARLVLECQQPAPTGWDTPFSGFFYDDPSRKLIAHVSHRSHDSEPVAALARLCETFPGHADAPAWRKGLELYAGYIKQACAYTAPYGVAPASIYHEDEAYRDKEVDLGMIARYLVDDERRENYRQQVRNGAPLGQGYYLRSFPVAFQHRGNHSLTLAQGKAAAVAARVLGDSELAEVARRQLEWIVGRNPFAESVMFGEGYDYCQEYAVLPGEMVGELGVGFPCLDEHDLPFWPQVNTCVYKEVWIRPPLQWLWLLADVLALPEGL